MDILKFRGVVRGNTQDVSPRAPGSQHRRAELRGAWESIGHIYSDMAKGLADPSASVLPPVGRVACASMARHRGGWELAA